MFQAFTLLLAALGAIEGARLVYGLLTSYIRRRNSRQVFLGRSTKAYIAIGSSSDGKSARQSDDHALGEMRKEMRKAPTVGWMIPDTLHTANNVDAPSLHADPLLIFGSPRINPVADDLQRRIQMPFEFVNLTPELLPAHSVLCIYQSTGQEYTCTLDPSLGEIEREKRPPSMSGLEEDYGVLVVGHLTDSQAKDQRVIWAAGIHGIGTLGVIKWALANLDKVEWEGNVCFLIRVGFRTPPGEPFFTGGPHENISNTEPKLICGPCKWQPRPQPATARTSEGILCDMGSVLLPFERCRFEHNLRHLLGIDSIPEKQRLAIYELQKAFEEGSEDTATFLDKMHRILDRTAAHHAAIEQAWKDIFWRNEREIRLLHKYRNRDSVKLVLISNTDPLRLDHALHRLGLEQLFDREHVVASFDQGVRLKGIDNSMVIKGLSYLKRDFQNKQFAVVFIDDVREYLCRAQVDGLGIDNLQFRCFSQLVYELRKYGLYESMSITY